MADWSLKVVKPENFRGTANILSNGGNNPLTAMFGRDETENPEVKGYPLSLPSGNGRLGRTAFR